MATQQQQKVNYEANLLNAWNAWRQNPTPENGDRLAKLATPLLEQIVGAYLGGQYITDPLLMGRAKTIMFRALQNYDPTKGPITSFIWTNMMRIQRVYGKQHSTLSVSEQLIMDAKRLETAEKELEEKLGRTPSTEELADYTGLSMKRIERIRRQSAVGYESTFEAGAGDSGGWLPSVQTQQPADLTKEYLQIIYEALGNERDKAIMEMSYGLNGYKPMKAIDIAKKLKVSPATVSKTLTTLDNKISEFMSMMREAT